MTFTRFFVQLMRRERQCMGFKLQITEKLNNNSEEGYKIQIVRCSFFKKTDVKAGKRRSIDSQGYPARETQRQNPEKTILEGFWAKGGLALCCQRQGAL
jgi:hypothetical protein